MGLLDTLERLLKVKPAPKAERVDLKEIYCKRRQKNLVQTFRTNVVGAAYKNIDGSDRQAALQKLKAGEKVRLIWDAGRTGNQTIVYLFRGGKAQKLAIPDCFGRLNDKVAADVIRWLHQDNIASAATVVNVTGGTRKRPKLSCVIELATYHAPTPKR